MAESIEKKLRRLVKSHRAEKCVIKADKIWIAIEKYWDSHRTLLLKILTEDTNESKREE
jgi:hypothetical protein